jgi:transposase
MKKSAHWAPAPNLRILTVERDETSWAVSLRGGDHAICPICQVRSHSRHSSYRRTLRDLSAQGTPVEVQAQMTRWRCRNDRCERRIFAERIPGLAVPFARRSAKDPKNHRAIIWRIVERGGESPLTRLAYAASWRSSGPEGGPQRPPVRHRRAHGPRGGLAP